MNLKKLFSSLFLIMLVPAAVMKNSAVAQSTTVVSVINPLTGASNFTFFTNVTSVSFRFNTTVRLSNVSNLFAYQVHLNYDSNVLNATQAWLPTWDSEWVFYDKTTVAPNPFFKTNHVKIGDSILIGETFNGSGLLAIIEFEIIKAPLKFQVTPLSSSLEIDNIHTYLLDSDLNDIPTTKVNGYYEYTWIAPPKPWLEVSPSLIEYGPFPPSAVGKEFDVEIYLKSLDPAWALTGVGFILNFNASILTVTNMSSNPLWTGFVANSTPGEIRVYVDKPSTTPSGDVLVATIRFRITYQATYPQVDASDLTLLNITLVNHLGEIPTNQPVNGTVIVHGLSPPPPWLEVSPTLAEHGPSPSIGQQFNVTVWIKSLDVEWNLANVTFSFVYNSTLIQLLGVTEGPFLREFGNTTFSTEMRTNRVYVENAFVNSPTTYPKGEGIVATLLFNITYQGVVPEVREGPLNLTDIRLSDKDGNEVLINTTRVLNVLYRIKSLYNSKITLSIDKSSVTVGTNITISGNITPLRANVNVTIHFRIAGTQAWDTLEIVKTDSDGNFEYIWSTTDPGHYELKASWPGDENTLPTESEIETVNVEPPINVFLYVLVAVIIAVIAIAIILHYRKIRKSKQPS